MKTKDILKRLKKIKVKDPKKNDFIIKEAIEKIWFHNEMHKHYKELYEVAMWELRFSGIQKQHYMSMLDEVEVLLDKNIKSSLIKKVIENWKERWMIDISIHFNEKNEIKTLF